jgi:hypothetical protein
MPKLLLTDAKGRQRAAKLVPVASSQQPNEIQKRELDQINKRLSPELLAEMSTRGLTIPPSEIALLLSRLKSSADLNITIAD